MKPILEHLPKADQESFVVAFFDYPFYPTPWHFHPEYELVLVTESSGKRFVGDSISNFVPGDLALLGPNLPHLYRNDPEYYLPGSDLRAKSVVVHFSERSFGPGFTSVPEAALLHKLFVRSQRGVHLTGHTRTVVSEALLALCRQTGFNRWLKLLETLYLIAESEEYTLISGTPVTGQHEKESDRLHTVFEFVMKHFSRSISVAEVASLVNLTENSFSRYFSQRTRKPFTVFVNEVRLSNACSLLVKSSRSVADICFACGFNNLSHFNRQFKRAYRMGPLAYRKLYWQST